MSERPRASDLRGLMLRATDAATALERRAREDRVFRTVTERINAGVYLEDIADHVYESFRELIPYDRIGLALLEQGDRVLRARWTRAEYQARGIERGFTGTMSRSSLERVLETREPRVLNDLEAYAEAHPESESTARILAEGVRSSLTCPLVAAGRPVGFLFFSSLRKNTYCPDHVQLFQEIANTLSVVVERAHMLEQLAQLNLELAAKNRELRAANARVRRMAVTDPLTRVANRRGLMAALRMGASFCERRRVPLSLVSFDIDHFKRVNDSLGHEAGDRVLRHVAMEARACCRREDMLGRSGGEEFLVVLPGTSEGDAAVLGERLRRRLAGTRPPGVRVGVTASFGVAERQPDEPLPSLLRRADRALYAAKDAGRDRVVRHSELAALELTRPELRARA